MTSGSMGTPAGRSAGPGTSAAMGVVHGMHPTRGYPVTWHITPVPGGLRRHVGFLVEQADGMIEDDEAWLYAPKTVEVVTAEEARELVERVAHRRG